MGLGFRVLPTPGLGNHLNGIGGGGIGVECGFLVQILTLVVNSLVL